MINTENDQYTLKMRNGIFQGTRIFIIPYGIPMKRIKLFKELILKNGGEVISDANASLTHVIIDESNFVNFNKVTNALKAVKLSLNDVKFDIVGTLWVSRCIKEKLLLDIEPFKFTLKRKADCGDQNLEEPANEVQRPELSLQLLEDSGIECEILNENRKVNETIIVEFQKLADAYRARGDQWRTVAYDKAIASLKSYKKPISNINDLQLFPHISNKMMHQISEIMEYGTCDKVKVICNDEQTIILELFNKVWGVGPNTAQLWYQMGCRTLEDLRSKVNLTFQQELGLKYFQEIQEPIPRHEVEEIIEIVKTAVQFVNSSLKVIPCGSYRRGKSFCGDVDIVVIANDTNNVLHKILSKLKSEDFLVDDLSLGKDPNTTKYLGLCRLPGESKKARRLDIFVTLEKNSACAVLHYTGSALFNRGIRRHASKMNMKITEYNLIVNGETVFTPTEESIFKQLQLEYKLPCDRGVF